MTTFSTRVILIDARLQGIAGLFGLQRTYFDSREYIRAKRETIDLSVNADAEALFVHVPKCAGTTIIRQMPLAHGHRPAQFFRMRDPALFARCFTFGFVRNPYDRLVSAFHYLRSDKTSARDADFNRATLARYPDFQAFAADLANPGARARVLGWLHFLPQSYYLCDRKGRIIVDFVGRTERFTEDLDKINEISGLEFRNIRARSVERASWREFYDAQTARHVENIYARDFEIFGYERLRDF